MKQQQVGYELSRAVHGANTQGDADLSSVGGAVESQRSVCPVRGDSASVVHSS